MKIFFIGQGLEPESSNAVGYYLTDYLNSKNFSRFTGISAFASEAAVVGMSNHFNVAKNNFRELTLIVGIDLEGTSKEALLEIQKLDIKSYIFYQSEHPVFHPKIYIFEGEKENKIIIGSSNLTGGGFFTNVESSILIEFESDDKEGLNFLHKIKDYFKFLLDFSDPNLFKITTDLIENLYESGIIPDEITRLRNLVKRDTTVSVTSKKKISIPKRETAKVPSAFIRKAKKILPAKAIPTTVIEAANNFDFDKLKLLWKSGPLTERDLNIPKGSNTNATGSMLLKKGLSSWISDQRHHFRDVVFKSLPWAADTNVEKNHLERATTFLKFIILGNDYGSHPVSLTHNTKTDTKSYLQKNSMTSISWGKAKSLIAKQELIGKSASLYQHNETDEFILMID